MWVAWQQYIENMLTDNIYNASPLSKLSFGVARLQPIT